MKPRLPNQFKSAEQASVPFAVILGDDELANGKVRIKQLGLGEGHPEKEGVLVEIPSLVPEVKKRLATFESGDISQKLEEVKV